MKFFNLSEISIHSLVKRETVDIIAEDKKLIEIYVAIVKELAVKYGVCA